MMDFLTLKKYVAHDMKMSHVYQPVMIKELLLSDKPVSARQIAKNFLEYDNSQIEYYERIVKNMPARVLKSHGIVKSVAGGYLLDLDECALSENQKDELIELCNQKRDIFLDKRGEKIWQHRRKGTGPISGSVRYEVLKRAGFRCSLCGISADERYLDVDHIIPRNAGGQDTPETLDNYQALCYVCNRNKRDTDNTDFRDWAKIYHAKQPQCIFCHPEPKRILAESELAYVFKDNYPVTESHVLVIPKRHAPSLFELYAPEINACIRLIGQFKNTIEAADKRVQGFNVGVNVGEASGQTILHCHWHLIPRRFGDVHNPRGGIRNTIPGKGDYK